MASALGFNEALAYCQNGRRFDLLIIGHSIPNTEKLALVAAFRAQSSAPVIALKRYGEAPVLHANFHVEPEPKELLAVIATLELGGAASA